MSRRADSLGVLEAFSSLRDLRKGRGLYDPDSSSVLSPQARQALGYEATQDHVLNAQLSRRLLIAADAIQLRPTARRLLVLTFAIVDQPKDEHTEADAELMEIIRKGPKWLRRIDATLEHDAALSQDAHGQRLRILPYDWNDQSQIRRMSDQLVLNVVTGLLDRHDAALFAPEAATNLLATSPAAAFRESVFSYAARLQSLNRHTALIELQQGVGWLLHTQAANAERVRLGELALDAALRTGNRFIQASIMIDDLGWANHMLDNDETAISRIKRGIEICESEEESSSDFKMLLAKARRHLSVISATTDPEASRDHLQAARDIVEKALPESTNRNIELGQLLHAEALSILRQLKSRQLPDEISLNKEDENLANDGLGAAIEARKYFLRSPGEQTRIAKSLYIEVTFLKLLRLTQRAADAEAELDEALANSAWEDGFNNQNFKGDIDE